MIWAEIMTQGYASRAFALTSADTIWDPGRAPAGEHLVGYEEFTAPGDDAESFALLKKQRTVIGKRVKTGVHNSFIAPVTVGDDAYTGAGSVIAKDVPDGALGISRPEQKNVEGYAERIKDQEPRE